MPYGYLGDTSTKIKQVKKNDGIITASDALDLTTQGHLGGSLELIQTQTHSGNVAYVDFTSLGGDEYDLLYVTYFDVIFASQQVPAMRFREAGTWEEADVYETAEEWKANNGTSEVRETTHGFMFLGNDCQGPWSGNLYIYGANKSGRYTHMNHQTTDYDADNGRYVNTWGGASLPQESVVDGIRIGSSDFSTNMTSYNMSLYGIKQI